MRHQSFMETGLRKILQQTVTILGISIPSVILISFSGHAKLNFKIAEIPIRYRSRTYGTTNIDRWQHGWLLLKMVFVCRQTIKFI